MKPRLTTEIVALRCAMELQDGWLVNLGIGLPTMCSGFVPEGRRVTFHSENGVVGYGRLAFQNEVDIHLVNAGVQHVTLRPGAFIVDSATAFAIARSGRLDCAVLGAYQVDAEGNLANHQLSNATGAQLGGAMDIATGAQRLFVFMGHTTSSGEPRILNRCSLPITAKGVVKKVFTDLAVINAGTDGLELAEIAPGWSPAEVQALTEAPLRISPLLKEIQV